MKMAEEDIRRYSLNELIEMREKGLTQTRPDAPEYDTPEGFWDDAEIVMPAAKKSVHLRVDEDVLEWFKAQGPGHLTRMQAVLRSYYESQNKS